MTGTVYSGAYLTGIVLSNPASQRTTTVAATGTVTSANADAIYGTPALAWIIANFGTIENTRTTGYGVHLAGGGNISNVPVASDATAASGLIAGYGGILIENAAGTVANLGTIEGTGTNSNGVLLTTGGRATNGSVVATSALISGTANGLNIGGGLGSVSNFGTIENRSGGSAVVLSTGTVSNGSNTSTSALITGFRMGVYFDGGAGTISNFAKITGDTAIYLLKGGRITNGAPNSTAAEIIGVAGNGALVTGAAGTVANFATIEATAFDPAIEMAAGGNIINGSVSDSDALITNTTGGTAISFDDRPGTVTNFGTIGDTISLSNGGVVTNGSSAAPAALIDGSEGGISIGGALGTVTNFGTIEASGSFVVIDLSGGTVVNGQSGSTTGLIEGGAPISVSSGAGTIINYGTLDSTGEIAVELGAGGVLSNFNVITGNLVDFFDPSAPVTVNNAGTVDGDIGIGMGSVTNSSTGVISSAQPSVIEGQRGFLAVANHGTIENTGTSGEAVYLDDGGSVTNYVGGIIISSGEEGSVVANKTAAVRNLGTIFGINLRNGGRVVNGQSGSTIGLIEDGVGLTNGLSDITNYGSMTGGVYVGDEATVTNVGVIVDSRFAGVTTGFNDPATIINSGTIGETASSRPGIFLNGGGKITNAKSGVIEGFSTGIYLRGGVVTNFGTVIGATAFIGSGSGNETLINHGAVLSTTTSGIAVDMQSHLGSKLVIDEPGAVFKGSILGGGRGEIEFAGAGAAKMTGVSGFETILLANGVSHSLTLANANFAGVLSNRITVIGGNTGNTLDASAVITTPLSTIIYGGAGKDVLTGGAGDDTFVFVASALSATDRISGGSGAHNTLLVTTAGTVATAGVSRIETYRLGNGGADTLILTNANFAGVPVGEAITVHGGNSGNTIDGSALTGSARKLVIYSGTGVDMLKGGAGNDIFVFAGANLTAADKVNGGSGANELLMTTAGTVAAAGVSGVETYVLADGGENALSLATGNFAGVSGKVITVDGGSGGNTISERSAAATDRVVMKGGAGADTLIAGQNAAMTGGGGKDVFELTTPGTVKTPDKNTIADFRHNFDQVQFSKSGFTLGANPVATVLFTASPTGSFTNRSQRFAYDTKTGQLFFDAHGNAPGSSRLLIATLNTQPNLIASDIAFAT